MGCLLGKLTVLDGFDPGGALSASAGAAAGDDDDNRFRVSAPTSQLRRGLLLSAPTDPSGWPLWLSAVAGDALRGWLPRRATSFQKLEKIGSGTYSNVYKARDLETGRVVAMKKVRVERVNGKEAEEGVRFMAREISLLRRLNHPNVVRLEGVATSRIADSPSLYLILEYLDHDLAVLAASPGVQFSEAQVKYYMKQLLSGLEHCHSQGVLHRDIKGSNLLLNKEGILKIADFGLATSYDPDHMQPMTSNVVTLWYRPPELLLGATHYGVGVDLWSVGCILAELLTGKPILPGRTEVEQLHRIFKLCGSPSEDYWKKSKLPQKPTFGPYKRCIAETFANLSPSSLSLIETFLAVDPAERGTATAALNSEFFTTEPYACEPSSLPQYTPTKEIDRNLRVAKARMHRRINGKENCEATKRVQFGHLGCGSLQAPEANADPYVKLARRRLMTGSSIISRYKRFPPPHLDAAIGFPRDVLHESTESFSMMDLSFDSSIVGAKRVLGGTLPGSVDHSGRGTSRRKIRSKEYHYMTPHSVQIGALRPYSKAHLMEPRNKNKAYIRSRN
ncbi:probable serine/threonine-protein kinase At1g54610 [Phoenix dactylifera]|uniref:[RNA-polymerase]-subunit kinase n=1 Tax=Phoenix dactylifera TaxID=42345 RepID=A0A8B7CKY2_PHODC|nr:probable serine/threonine-protein kinase At1g54610 [Phoenix dactylifera]